LGAGRRRADIEDGMIDLPLAKQPGTGGEKMHVDEKEGQPSRTRYRVVERAGNRACWVELQPYTGRTHQFRVHMAAIGHPDRRRRQIWRQGCVS
jgi:23S rRNA pseudouridine955/2504/2580 synthase